MKMKQQLKLLLVARHRVKYGLDYFLDYFLNHFMDQIFLDHFIGGGKHTISTQGGVGCSLSVPRAGWKKISKIYNIAFTILAPLLSYDVPFESTCAPSVASRFLLCIQ